ncbi:MAG: AmmeMemoRadiSam system radical SAM enzyme [Acidobacteria bacterium]|nr:AmmeMemoRadiSam system radical SAM enzyme [Acidobacteriota bacterium]
MNNKFSNISRRSFLTWCGGTLSACAVSSLPLVNPGPLSAADGPDKKKGVKEAKYVEKLGDKKVQCKLCPHECRVADLERGTCGVRENRDGTYYTLVYGTPCSANIDPIEKKPLFHYFPTTNAFSIATAGCNFVCKFCQNWEISQKRPEQVQSIDLAPEHVIAIAKNKGCKTVAHTYTEPVIFYEYMLDCAILGKREGVPNIMISNGFIQEKPMRELCRYLGAVKIDLKAFTEKFYSEICAGKLKPVLDTLKVLKEEGIWFEIVVLLIPTLNDSIKEISEMTQWIVKELGSDVPLHFSRYYPTFMLKNIPPTPPETLLNARKVAMANGVKFAYAGNILSEGENTYCPRCGKILIERMRFVANITGMKGNACKYCREIIPGVFG